jgi:hypothetical protein
MCRKKLCASEETEMSRLGQAWLALSFSAAAVLPAHAQITVEMTKITCEQANLKTTVMDAAEKVLGVKR